MANEANIIRFPNPEKRVTCRLRLPRFGDTIAQAEDVASGMGEVAVALQRAAEHFDEIAQIFDECRDATFCRDTVFVDGHLTFEFYVPARYLPRLREMGWHSETRGP